METNKIEKLKKCNICPHNCKVNRLEGQKGFCNCTGDRIKYSLSSIHYFEEPCISGTIYENGKIVKKINNGSGTIFFTNCNLKCIYCQNYEISSGGNGKEITIEELADIMIDLQNKNANNINLVTPTMYAYHIIEAIKIAKGKGLIIPIIYNCGGYEKIETLKELEPYIDVYLPDFKYYSNEISKKYSYIDDYFKYASNAIKEMIRQKGEAKFDKNGIIQQGVIIRHMVLPNHILNSKHILKWIKENLPEETSISVMAQYFPTKIIKEKCKDKNREENKIELINRKLTKNEFKEIEEYMSLLDFKNGYIQELGEHEEEYVPDFSQNK